MDRMTRIHILAVDNNPNSFSFVFPILINKKGLLERNVKVRLFYSIKEGLYDCDMVFLDNKYFKHWWQFKEEEIYKFLISLKKRVGAVLWFDTSDSTGTPQFEVLPYVDGYYKNQILRDVKLYCNNFYRARIFSDYYHRKYGISDNIETGRESPVDSAYLHKIDISWNPGLNDHGVFGNNYSWLGDIRSHLRRYSLYNYKYTVRFIRVRKERKIDITARPGLTHPRNFVIFHRELLMKKIKKFNIDTGFINHSAYYKELQNVKLCISPFGLGELSYRDFETIICGALLIKPDMSHMKTWPDIYIENKTYVKCDWDFSDLEEKVKFLLSNPKIVHDIAKEAQRNYRYYLFGGGRIDFCDRISEIVSKHIN